MIGAGIVGAACAYYCAEAGLRVAVVERGAVASGTTSAGEGNILVSDKEPGAELDLALLSVRLWAELGERLGDRFELHAKGGVVVARTPDAVAGLDTLIGRQRACGIEVTRVGAAGLAELEPQLTRDVAGGAYYPQDMQVQPMLAAAELLRRPARGARPCTPERRSWVSDRDSASVRTTRGDLAARWVVNAAGTWGGEVAELAGAPVPVLPRRGFILVTEPLPPRHPAQGVHRRVRGQRRQRRRRAGDLGRGRGHPGRDRPHRRQPRAGRVRPPDVAAGAAHARRAGRRAVPVPRRRDAPADLPRLPAVLSGPPAGHRPGPAGAGAGARVRPRGRRHRAGRRDRPPHRADADRGDARPGPDAVPARSGSRRPHDDVLLRRQGDHRRAGPERRRGAARRRLPVVADHPARGAPRGLFCGIGVCFDCLVVVNGGPNQRACLDRGARRRRGRAAGGHRP